MKFRFSLAKRQAIEGLLFITPWIIGFTAFIAYPLFQSFWYSLHNVRFSGASLRMDFIGLQNFKDAFLLDVDFLPHLIDMSGKLFLQLPVVITFSLILALLLNQKVPGTAIFRAMYFLPVVFASGVVLREMFSLGAGNLPIMDSISTEKMLAIGLSVELANALMQLIQQVVRGLWGSGVQIVIFLAGLQSIPPSMYEAARVDGASPWEIFWKITLPMLSPVILLNVIYTIVDGFTDVFNPVLNYIQSVAFGGTFRLGFAAALGWVYFLYIFLILVIALRVSRKYVFYAGTR